MTADAALSDAKRALLAKIMRGGGDRAAAATAISKRPADAIVPLSAAQRQVWLHAAMAPDVPLYNESITIHRLGSFDLAAMEKSLGEIVRRHEIWRTSFALDGAEPVQIVHPDVRLDLPVDDVSHLPPSERDAAALAIGTADAHRPIDLATAPLFRARIVKLAENEHRLYLTLHHIIFDGVAIYRVIVPELAALYEAFAQGLPSPLPEPSLGYGDYAVWQQAHLQSPAIQKQIDYWRGALADAPPKLALAGDRAKPPVPTHAGSMENFAIPLALTERLKDFSRAEGVTLYMTLLAGFQAMLHRYSGEEDILVGGVTDLRRRPELEKVVGYFLNTIALRSRPKGDMPFRALLAQVRDTVLGALGASEVPFDEVVRALDVRRTPGAHPLFNILFSIEPPVEPFPPGWDLTQMDVVVGGAKFDLYLELDERPEGMVGRFLYSTEIFDPATIRRMIGHWLTLLKAAVADPDCRLADLPLMTANERAQLAAWNDTARPIPDLSVPEAVAAQARATPDAAAVELGARRWSYAGLDATADRVAAALGAAGVGKGALVAVCLDRSFEMVAALIGILRAGAAYLPLDPNFPSARLDHIVRDARPDALLIEQGLRGVVPTADIPLIAIEDAVRAEGALPPVAIEQGDLAYVLYTSGSTGKPKGVEIEHRALANLLAAMRDAPGFAAGDKLLAVTTLSFDIAALELFLPLVSGGTLILAPSDVARDPDRLAALVAASRPSVMQATPATWCALLEAGWAGDPALKILCGGEVLPRDLAGRLGARCASLWNMYGPTETTIWSAVERVVHAPGPVPIGRPIANTWFWVLDGEGRAVPPGVIGELHIGGAGLARGYRGRPDLTAERFGETPAAPGVRLYRTGDLARQRADGTFFCLGRTDNDEKIRGFRVAVEEIEGALAAHPAIAAAAVKSWPDASGERALAAYLVARGDELSTSALRAHLAESLPDYMVPSRFVYLPALPMTPNSKIDRKALPTPAATAAPDTFVPPQGETEEKLAVLWGEILGVDAVGRHDSFFDLGGHSLLVAKLLRRLESDHGRKLGMATFFRAHRLNEMAMTLAEEALPGDAHNAVPVQPLGWRPPLLWLDAGPTFLPLAQSIGTDQPFLGIPVDPILEREAGHPNDFRDFARHVVEAIRRVRSRGPYYIGGWCTSGILAFEVASQLREAGADIPLLLLAHSSNPAALKRFGPTRIRMSKARFHARQLIRLRAGERGRYLRDRAQGALEQLQFSRARTAAGTHGALRAMLDRAAYAYRPDPYDGDVALFQPVERPDVLDARPGWEEVVRGDLATFEIAGGHRTMLERPHVEAFAAVMRAVLVDAQNRAADAAPLRATG